MNRFKTNIKKTLVYLFVLQAFTAFSQSDSLYSIKPEISISGFADAYYSYDLNEHSSFRACLSADRRSREIFSLLSTLLIDSKKSCIQRRSEMTF